MHGDLNPRTARDTRSQLAEVTGVSILCVLLAAIAACRTGSPAVLTLATTTSVGNSGLLDVLTKRYATDHDTAIRTQLVGSGLALRMLDEGHADVVISHSPTAEAAALQSHPRWQYRKIMWNAFILVGPAEDPAGIAGAPDAAEAMRRIAASGATFLSRGDKSGTHEREEMLWAQAAARPARGRLVVAGAGMGTTLRTASQTGAYTLTDTATYGQLARQLDLRVLVEGDPQLLNTYAVIYDPDLEHGSRAAAFARWLIDGAGREEIDRFRIAGGVVAFAPWPRGHPSGRPTDVPR
jgi:tungstate transport system substrate-binding protein